MPLSSQKQIMVQADVMNGRAIGKLRDSYARNVSRPIATAVRGAKNNAGLLRQLGAGLVRGMDMEFLAEALEETGNAGTGVGLVSALPKGKRQRVEKSKTDN